jgi:hypothetical protein
MLCDNRLSGKQSFKFFGLPSQADLKRTFIIDEMVSL